MRKICWYRSLHSRNEAWSVKLTPGWARKRQCHRARARRRAATTERNARVDERERLARPDVAVGQRRVLLLAGRVEDLEQAGLAVDAHDVGPVFWWGRGGERAQVRTGRRKGEKEGKGRQSATARGREHRPGASERTAPPRNAGDRQLSSMVGSYESTTRWWTICTLVGSRRGKRGREREGVDGSASEHRARAREKRGMGDGRQGRLADAAGA